MSVKIRLQRGGRTKLPVYSIVVADSHRARDGRFIERLGYYAPKAKVSEQGLSLNEERLNHWIGLGAQPSDVVIRLMTKLSIGPVALREARAAKKARRIKAEEYAKNFAAKRDAAKAAKEGQGAEGHAEPAPEPVAEAAPAPVEAAPAAEPVATEAPVETPAAEEAPAA